MGDTFGKQSKRKQTSAMNAMNAKIQEQVDMFGKDRTVARDRAAETRQQYEDFQFSNPFGNMQNAFGGLQTDFSNLAAGAENKYEGMENRFEDMTVDMRAADFQTQQGQQQRANILQSLRGSAGSSGVAGLAQSLANQGQMQSQQIAAGISQQERQNQMLAAQEGSRIDMTQRGASMQLQQMGIAGAEQARSMGVSRENLIAQGAGAADMAQREGAAAQQAAEAGQQATLLGMDYGAMAGANQAYQGALSNQMSGMGMKADMYGAQSQNNMFSQLTDAAMAKAQFACIPKGISIDTTDGKILVENIKPGDIVIGYNGSPVKVLQKHEYLEDPTKERFYKVEFNNGSIVEVCDMHRIKGERAKDITEDVKSKEVYSGVEFSYDLLTEDAGYRMNGIPVNSMIEEMAELIVKLKNK